MLMILIDAVVLMVLLKMVSDDDIEFVTALVIGFVTAIATTALAMALGSFLGIAGLILAGVIAAVGLGIAVSSFFGVEIKRAMLIGLIFMIVHIGISLGINLALAS
ncbi:MAG: hypothetical protein AAF456_14655 [Planctomycetota bacterium]